MSTVIYKGDSCGFVCAAVGQLNCHILIKNYIKLYPADMIIKLAKRRSIWYCFGISSKAPSSLHFFVRSWSFSMDNPWSVWFQALSKCGFKPLPNSYQHPDLHVLCVWDMMSDWAHYSLVIL